MRLLAVLCVAMFIAAACTGDDDASGGDPSGESTGDTGGDTGAEVKNPGVIVYAQEIEPLTLDPAGVSQIEGGTIETAYEFLVDTAAEGPDLVPKLATEVPSTDNGLISEDGLTYTFPIREGVTFHDGTDLTAEDVKYSWDRAITMNLPEGDSATLSNIIAETRVVDDFTFEVTLQKSVGWFLNSVVNSRTAMVVSQDAVEANGGVVAGQPNEFMATNMVGTGPLKFVRWDRNEQLSLEKFEDYWGEPAFHDARFEYLGDENAILLGLLAGDFDVTAPEPAFLEQIEANPDVCVTEEGFLIEPIIAAFNLNIDEAALPPDDTIPANFFHDVRIRKAFNHAFNYDQFIEVVMKGNAAPATYIPPALFAYDENAPHHTYDPEQAEALFREAGVWDEGFTMTVLTEGGHSIFEPAALLMKDNIEALNPNFRVNVAAVAEAQFDEAFASVPFPYAMWFKNADAFHDPHFYFQEYHHPDGAWGEALGLRNGYADPDGMAALIEAAEVESDEDARYELYGQLQQRVYDEPNWLWMAEETNVQIFRCWITNFVYNPLWVIPRVALYQKG